MMGPLDGAYKFLCRASLSLLSFLPNSHVIAGKHLIPWVNASRSSPPLESSPKATRNRTTAASPSTTTSGATEKYPCSLSIASSSSSRVQVIR
ncbi:hypothetical protein BDV98DRAFT_659331 [Pterulicium gracile]|uniref:Uncharacterized protein n=1 Tax=Pterulicium gracile TaxID=1884261 RepID=A0A5C3Q310_9AGAR|nr:hypothetical protein BDV98DRAFT_659331 [Pterula gracilis]